VKRFFLPAAVILSAALGASAATSWASRDIRYNRTSPLPSAIVADTTLNAWRGERLGALALIGTDSRTVASVRFTGPLKGCAHFTDFVLTDDFRKCGPHPSDLTPWEIADIIDNTSSEAVIEAGETRPVWVTLDIPSDMRPGLYTDTLFIDGEQLTLNVNVQKPVLPSPDKRAFYLNLWQQPYSVSRYHKVEPWSREHFDLLKPYARMLALAGQRAISTILFFEPWGEQSNDLFLPMVETTRKADGSWNYDYTVFDRWVEFMTENGVGPDIECFTMIPWEMNFRYFDEAAGDYRFLKTTTGAPEYADLWGNFLRALVKHLDEKGWTERAVIAMDERSAPDMLNALSVIENAAPQLKVSLAGNYHPELIDRLYSCSLTLGTPYPPGAVEKRRANGQVSTLYTCCSSPEPNLFSNNMPADAAWIPLYATATGHDGYLHWSWLNWTDDPMHDSRFKMFAPGDTYFIYPEGRSSVRFERLIEGIQLGEKVRLLKECFTAENDARALDELNRALVPVMLNQVDGNSTTAMQVNNVVSVIDRLSER